MANVGTANETNGALFDCDSHRTTSTSRLATVATASLRDNALLQAPLQKPPQKARMNEIFIRSTSRQLMFRYGNRTNLNQSNQWVTQSPSSEDEDDLDDEDQSETETLNETETSVDFDAERLKAERELYEQVFVQYIGSDHNDECTLDEWKIGLRKLNVNLSEKEQEVLFKLMDVEHYGTVDQNDFVSTMMGNFELDQLNALKQPIIDAVHNVHENGTRSPICILQSQFPSQFGTTIEPQSVYSILSQRDQKAQQESLEQVFEQYIAPRNNVECDFDEWKLGLLKLNIPLIEYQQRALFKLMDIDESGMVDKEQFVQTMMRKHEYEELNLLKQPILDAVRSMRYKPKHHSKHHVITHSNEVINTALLITPPQTPQSPGPNWTDHALTELKEEHESRLSETRDELTYEQSNQLTHDSVINTQSTGSILDHLLLEVGTVQTYNTQNDNASTGMEEDVLSNWTDHEMDQLRRQMMSIQGNSSVVPLCDLFKGTDQVNV